MKIRTRIIAIVFITFLFMTIFVGGVLVYVSNKVVKNQIDSYLHLSSKSKAENIRTYLDDQIQSSEMLSGTYVYQAYLDNPSSAEAKAKVHERLDSIILIDNTIIDIKLLNSSGRVLVSSDSKYEGEDVSSADYFINAKKKSYVKSVYYDSALNQNIYSISSPVKDSKSGELKGVSVSLYKTNELYNMVSNESGLGATEENFLVNSDKYFISPSLFLGSSVILNKVVDTQNVNQCFNTDEISYVTKNGYSGLSDYLGSKSIFENKDYRGVDVIAAHEYIPETGWCLVTKVDSTQVQVLLGDLTYSVIYILVSAALVWLLISILVFNRMTQPIIKLNNLVKDAIKGNYTLRSDSKAKDEIGALARSYNLLMDTIVSTRSDIDKQVREQTVDILNKDKELKRRQAAILNILDDVRIEKDKAQILAQDLRKFQLAVDGTTEQIIITDPDGMILYANKGTERLTGFAVNEIIGKKAGSKELWGGLMPVDVYKYVWKVIKHDKKPYSGIFKNKRKNGEYYEAASTLTPILDEKGEVIYFVGIERDITKEREVDRAKTEFVSLASHQLRTPLSAINWYTEMLLNQDAGKINSEQKTYLEEIYNGNQKMVELVNALLNVSRLDMGTFEIKPLSVDIKSVVEDVLGEMKHAIKDRKQDVEVKYSHNLPEISADPGLLRIIFQNLLSNAIKYTPDGGKILISAEYNPEHPRATYVFKVSDSGYGIPDNQKDKVFTKLFRADNARDIDTQGTGLGLYIVKSILDESNGDISFVSKLGKGTTFRITLPKTGMKQKIREHTEQ